MKLIKIQNGYLITTDDSQETENETQNEVLAQGTIDDLKKVVYELIVNTSILSTHAAITQVTNNFIPANKVALIEMVANQEYKILITYGMQFGINTSANAWTGGLLKIVKLLEEKITI